jgi:hypothetical protein
MNVSSLLKSEAYQEMYPENFSFSYSNADGLPMNMSSKYSPDYRRYTVHDVLKLDSKEHLNCFDYSNRQMGVKNDFFNECVSPISHFDSLHFDRLLSDINQSEIQNNKKNTDLLSDPFHPSMSFLHSLDFCDPKELNVKETERNGVPISLAENDTAKSNFFVFC